jgi:hypothetical protein
MVIFCLFSFRFLEAINYSTTRNSSSHQTKETLLLKLNQVLEKQQHFQLEFLQRIDPKSPQRLRQLFLPLQENWRNKLTKLFSASVNL